MRRELLAWLLVAATLAGCAAGADAPPPEGQAMLVEASTPEPPLVAGACAETQAEIPTEPGDYPPDRMPPGFEVILDANGKPTVVALTRSCAVDGAVGELFVAFVLARPPEALALAGADHGIVLDLWSDLRPVSDALAAWGFSTVEERPIELAKTAAAGATESRTASRDFLLTIAGTSPADARYGLLRLFEVDFDARNVTAALDAQRAPGPAVEGPATASFIVQPPRLPVVDLPFHRAGAGRIAMSESEVVYQRAAVSTTPQEG